MDNLTQDPQEKTNSESTIYDKVFSKKNKIEHVMILFISLLIVLILIILFEIYVNSITPNPPITLKNQNSNQMNSPIITPKTSAQALSILNAEKKNLSNESSISNKAYNDFVLSQKNNSQGSVQYNLILSQY